MFIDGSVRPAQHPIPLYLELTNQSQEIFRDQRISTGKATHPQISHSTHQPLRLGSWTLSPHQLEEPFTLRLATQLTNLSGLCLKSLKPYHRRGLVKLRSCLSLRSRRKRKAWGESPRDISNHKSQPVTTSDSRLFRESFTRSRGLPLENRSFPGARAPGFMLTPASQAKKQILHSIR